MKKLKLWGLLVFVFGAIFLLPNKVLAEANFDELLTDGKFVVHSVKPTSQEMAYYVVFVHALMANYTDYETPYYYIDYDKPCNDDYTKCTIYYGDYNIESDPSKEVEMSYVYDNDVKTKVDSLIKKLDGKDTFSLNDIEFINYLMNGSEDSSMGNYSSELKRAIDYKNFNIDVVKMDDTPFYEESGGSAIFSYDDTLYYIKPMITVPAKHIIYVDDNTTDVLASVKTRLTKVFGTDFNVKEKGTIASFLASEKVKLMSEYDDNPYLQQQYDTAEDWADEWMSTNYYNDDARYHFVTDSNVYEKYYTLTINNKEVSFLVVKDSSKINNNVNLITNDVVNDITISAASSTIPLDTVIKVTKLTKGADYEKIIKTLNVRNSETFDLSLYSKSINKNITEGNFEVKIPISDALKGKSLIAYYVDEKSNIEEHEVTIKDGYALFTTDHLSIYTLAEKTSSTTPTTPVEPTTNNPQTSDNVLTYVGMLFVSTLGVIGLSRIYLKNKKNIKNN